MTEFKKRLLLSLLALPFTQAVGWVFTHALSYWGILVPLAKLLGDWLKVIFGTSIDLPGMLWAIAVIFSFFLYAGALFLIWKRNRLHSVTSPTAHGSGNAASSRGAVSSSPPVESIMRYLMQALPKRKISRHNLVHFPPACTFQGYGSNAASCGAVSHIYNIHGFNGSGEGIFIKYLEGQIWIELRDDRSAAVQRRSLPRPKLVELNNPTIGAYAPFAIILEQELPKRLAEEWVHAEDGAQYSFNFDDLYIVFQ